MPTQLRESSTDSQTLRILESPGSHCIEEEPEAHGGKELVYVS